MVGCSEPDFRKALDPLIAYEHIIYAAARRKFIEGFLALILMPYGK